MKDKVADQLHVTFIRVQESLTTTTTTTTTTTMIIIERVSTRVVVVVVVTQPDRLPTHAREFSA